MVLSFICCGDTHNIVVPFSEAVPWVTHFLGVDVKVGEVRVCCGNAGCVVGSGKLNELCVVFCIGHGICHGRLLDWINGFGLLKGLRQLLTRMPMPKLLRLPSAKRTET
jgi:hypothetical protein